MPEHALFTLDVGLPPERVATTTSAFLQPFPKKTTNHQINNPFISPSFKLSIEFYTEHVLVDQIRGCTRHGDGEFVGLTIGASVGIDDLSARAEGLFSPMRA
jgi:hypothetical protein